MDEFTAWYETCWSVVKIEKNECRVYAFNSLFNTVDSIKFGKFTGTMNTTGFMKDFKVYGGLEKDKMILLLDASLKPSTEAETFSLQFTLPNDKTVRYFPIVLTRRYSLFYI